MALFVPSSRRLAGSQNYTSGVRPSDTIGTLITASSTVDTLGTITEIITSTTYEAEWLRIYVGNTSASATITDQLMNVYIGASGSEVLLIDSLISGWSAPVAAGTYTIYWFPVRIPRGSRISAALRSVISSDTCEVYLEYGIQNGESWVGSGIETIGQVTASSNGTHVTPGTTSSGSWVSIGTTSQIYRYCVIGVQSNNDTSLIAGAVRWDVGTSSAVLQNMSDFWVFNSSTENITPWLARGWWVDIPSGTTLEARGQASGSISGYQAVCIYGVY